MDSISLNIVCSNRDHAGNVYWAFTAFNHTTDKAVSGTISGGESNIRSAEFHLRGRHPVNGETRWNVNVAQIPIRKWNQLVKGWPYAGCAPQDLLQFILKGTV